MQAFMPIRQKMAEIVDIVNTFKKRFPLLLQLRFAPFILVPEVKRRCPGSGIADEIKTALADARAETTEVMKWERTGI